MSDERHDPLVGKILGDYTLSRLIAKGGMGRVYVADDGQLGRKVAVKVITLDEDLADEIMERFQREAQVIGKLDDHPNIITIHRYGKERGHHYIAMKYIRGHSLADYLEKLRSNSEFMHEHEMLHILKQVAAALDYAHSHGVIHRDIKPANIMLDKNPSLPGQWHATLMDFGLVMQLDNNMTSGTAFGTPRYIAPEQAISSTDACAESDIYSLGVVVYEMLSGQTPFDNDESPVAVALSHVTKIPPSPRTFRPDLNESVVPVIMKVLEKKPEDRYQTATAFVAALELALTGKLPETKMVVAPPKKIAIEPDKPTVEVDIRGFEDDDDTAIPRPEIITGEFKPVRSRRMLKSMMGLGALVVIAILAFIFLLGGSSGAEEVPFAVAGDGTLELHYDDEGLTVRNASTYTLVLTSVELRQNDVVFNFDDFGHSSLINWKPGMCAFVAQVHASYTPVSDCPSQNVRSPLLYANSRNFVWLSSDNQFDVYQDNKRLGTCVRSEQTCVIQGVKRVAGS